LTKFQEARVLTDKSFAGTATPQEKIRSVDELVVRYEPYVNPSDMKILIRNFNEGGSISGLTESKAKNAFQFYSEATDKEIDTDKGVKEEYQTFYRFLVTRIEPGVELTDAKLKDLGATFFSEGRKTGWKSIFGFGDKTYGEALEEGTEMTWLPQLNDQMRKMAEQARVRINREAQRQGKEILDASELSLSRIYKKAIMKLPHKD
jgi:hypothetical protein